MDKALVENDVYALAYLCIGSYGKKKIQMLMFPVHWFANVISTRISCSALIYVDINMF